MKHLIIIVDQNKSSEKALRMRDLRKKFNSFGIEVQVKDTIKGDGVKMMQDPSWHNRKLTKEDYEKVLQELS